MTVDTYSDAHSTVAEPNAADARPWAGYPSLE